MPAHLPLADLDDWVPQEISSMFSGDVPSGPETVGPLL
jgi:hypothetical protein